MITVQLTQEQRDMLEAVLAAAITGDKSITYTEAGQAVLFAIKEQL